MEDNTLSLVDVYDLALESAYRHLSMADTSYDEATWTDVIAQISSLIALETMGDDDPPEPVLDPFDPDTSIVLM